MVAQTLARVGVQVASHSVSFDAVSSAVVLHLPSQRERVILSARLAPEPGNGLAAAAKRRAASHLGGEACLWLSEPRVKPWGVAEISEELTAEALRYRADALLWHALAEHLVYGAPNGGLALLVDTRIDGVALPVPVAVYPSPQNAHLGWTAQAWIGPEASTRFAGTGLCSIAAIRPALDAHLYGETFDALPPVERCASTLDNHPRVGMNWDETCRADRAIALLLGLCCECAYNLRTTQVEPLPIQPPRWGEKYR